MSRSYLIQYLHRFVELHVPQERCQVLEEVNEELCVHGPALQSSIGVLATSLFKMQPYLWSVRAAYLLLRCVRQHPCNKNAVGDEFQPRIHKSRRFSWSQDMEGITATTHGDVSLNGKKKHRPTQRERYRTQRTEDLTKTRLVFGSWWSPGRARVHWAPEATWWKSGGTAVAGIPSAGRHGPGSALQPRYQAPRRTGRYGVRSSQNSSMRGPEAGEERVECSFLHLTRITLKSPNICHQL